MGTGREMLSQIKEIGNLRRGQLVFLNGVARAGLMKESMGCNSPTSEHLLSAYYVPGLGTRDLAVR